MFDKNIINNIRQIKDSMGKELLILTHHYQRKEIVELGDFKGDSFGLSQRAAMDEDAGYIVFCGVHFMAESAAILARPEQTVQIPDRRAGCPMADMAESSEVENAWEELVEISGRDTITPVVYMNSDVDLKAFTGRMNGTVCTSSNADAAIKWAFEKSDKILFLPDQHLGRNTASKMGIDPSKIILWEREKPLGGNSIDAISRARLILWDGYCIVHSRFTTEHVNTMRNDYPEAKIIVHPECSQEVVDLSDASGSTGFIVKFVKDAPISTTIVIGTEINMVDRLAHEFPDKTILPLNRSLCTNMFKISPEKLLYTLEHIGEHNVVRIPENLKKDAKKALNKMLALSA